MDDDIRLLKEHYNHLLVVAPTNRKINNLNSRRAFELKLYVHELKQANKLKETLNDALKDVNVVNEYHLDQTLNVFEALLDPVLAINEVMAESLADAASSRATTTLLPVEDLLRTLAISKANLSLQPLYDEDITKYYYP